MNEMSRLEKINQYAILKAQRDDQARMNKEKHLEELKQSIQALAPSVKELCSLLKALDSNKLLGTHPTFDKDFFSDAWSHKLGFRYLNGTLQNGTARTSSTSTMNSIGAIGKMGGGACKWDIWLDEEGKFYGIGEDLEFAMKRFLEEFDDFEANLFKFVDNLK